MSRLVAAVAALLLLGSVVILPNAVRAASPSFSEPRALILEAGPHVGIRLEADGSVVARKQVSLGQAVHVAAVGRKVIGTRGMHLLVEGGVLDGYWVAESRVAYVKGWVGNTPFSPPQAVLLPKGTIAAYRFNSSWDLASAVVRDVEVGHRRLADRTAVINGQPYYELIAGPWSGTWVPAQREGLARKVSCSTPTHVPVGAAELIRRKANAGSALALTFDMGGRLDPALRIMRYLLLNGVCTTIFPTGAAAETDTGAAVLEMVSQYPAIFEVGNHTMNHCDLVRGGGALACPDTRPTDGLVRRELVDAAAIIRGPAGESPIPYWRPPFGSYDSRVREAAASVSYSKTILWDVDTIDWQAVSHGGPTAAQIAAKVVKQGSSGSIVLMHLGGFHTRGALPAILHGLGTIRNLEPTSISDLLNGG